MSAARSELARLIRLQDGYAADVAETRTALAAIEAEAGDRAVERYDASTAVDSLQAEIDNAYWAYGGNRERVVQLFVETHGRALDDMLAEAKVAVADTEHRLRLAQEGAEIARAKNATACDNLRWAEGKIDAAAKAVLLEGYPTLFEQAQAAYAEAARLRFALSYVMRGVNLNAVQRGHALYEVREFLWDSNWTTQFETEGIQPWHNAFEALKTDAKAKLPIEVPLRPAEAA